MKPGIRAQFLTAIIIFTIIPLLILGVWLSWNNYVLEKEQLIHFQEEIAGQASQLIGAFFHENEHKIQSIVSTNYFPALSIAQQRELLSKHLHTEKDNLHREIFTGFTVLDKNGRESVRVSKKHLLSREPANRASSQEFTVPLTTKATYYSPIYFDQVSGEPLMKISVPLVELRQQEAVGVLIGEIKLNSLHTIITAITIGKTGYAYLTDRDGQVVVHPNPSVVLKRSNFLPPYKAEIIPGLNGKEAIVVAQKLSVGSQDLFCVTEFPTQDAFANLIDSIRIIFVVLFLSLSGAVILGFQLIRNFVRPIELLAETAGNISQGDFSQQVNLAREDEIGQLAISFDAMTVKLVSTIRELEKEKNFIGNAIEAITQPFYVINAIDHTILLANSASRFGVLTGRETCHCLVYGCDEPCEEHQRPCPITEIQKTGKPVIVRHTTNENGTDRTFDVHGYPIFDQRGEVANVIIYYVDITEKIKLEQQVRQSQKMEAVGTLAGGIAHDFNNILMVINGYAQIVYNEVHDNPSVADDMREIITAGTRARDLVRQILTISRSTTQQKMPLELPPVVKEIIKMLRSSIPSTIKIEQDISSNRMVFVDPSQIHQVVMNLCTNAYQEMCKTGGTLSISLEDFDITEEDNNYEELTPGEFVKLSIRDTGKGIAENLKNKIFEPYFTTKQDGDGTGLGLAVVHSIVQGYGGHISVDSGKEQGTIFTILLPCYVSNDSEEIIETVAPERDLAGTERIMIVDDEETIIILAQKVFGQYGYRIEGFTDSLEAVEHFTKQPEGYDLVITDMTMPNLTGIELAEKVMALRNDIPVILASGYSDLINREKAQEIGIAEFIGKPFTVQSLLQTVRKLLDRQPT